MAPKFAYIANPGDDICAPDSIKKVELCEKALPVQIVWKNVLWYIYLHSVALYGIYCFPFLQWKSMLWFFICYTISGLGITAGAHRLWAHKSYKAKLPTRIILALFNCMSGQNDIIEWARDHRVHHKYSETNADPHNARRGFFFAHIGWLMVRKHPNVKDKGASIDLSDLYADPVLVFQRKYYLCGMLLFCFILPAFVPWYCWTERFWSAFCTCSILRYCAVLHFTWFVNSIAHLWGNRPFDRTINPRENILVSLGAIGEGYHNYHHVFPQDYSASEVGSLLNPTTRFLDFLALLGQVYDRKKISSDIVNKRQVRTGDGTCGFGWFQTRK